MQYPHMYTAIHYRVSNCRQVSQPKVYPDSTSNGHSFGKNTCFGLVALFSAVLTLNHTMCSNKHTHALSLTCKILTHTYTYTLTPHPQSQVCTHIHVHAHTHKHTNVHTCNKAYQFHFKAACRRGDLHLKLLMKDTYGQLCLTQECIHCVVSHHLAPAT